MDIQFYGANCLVLSNKKARIVVDDNLAALGGQSVTKDGDISLFTSAHDPVASQTKITIDQPGEYEVSNVSIFGLQVRAHTDEVGQKNATIFKLTVDDIRVAIMGHVYPELSEIEQEALGIIDVMVIPVGGSGYTLDGIGALALIKAIDPKIIIPTHYADNAFRFPVPQQSLDEAIKALEMEPRETVTGKWQLKPSDIVEGTQLVVLKRA